MFIVRIPVPETSEGESPLPPQHHTNTAAVPTSGDIDHGRESVSPEPEAAPESPTPYKPTPVPGPHNPLGSDLASEWPGTDSDSESPAKIERQSQYDNWAAEQFLQFGGKRQPAGALPAEKKEGPPRKVRRGTGNDSDSDSDSDSDASVEREPDWQDDPWAIDRWLSYGGKSLPAGVVPPGKERGPVIEVFCGTADEWEELGGYAGLEARLKEEGRWFEPPKVDDNNDCHSSVEEVSEYDGEPSLGSPRPSGKRAREEEAEGHGEQKGPVKRPRLAKTPVSRRTKGKYCMRFHSTLSPFWSALIDCCL
jgi:hypothetical protein